MKKIYLVHCLLIGLLVVGLLASCGDAASSDFDPSEVAKADELEIVTLTETSQGDSLYLDVAVKNNSTLTLSSASVQFILFNGERVVDDGGAFYERLEPGQAASQKAAFYKVLGSAGSYTCYSYKVTVTTLARNGAEDPSDAKDYSGTCN